MKLPRLGHDPSHLLEFFDQSLTQMGAVCEQPWHDRLHLIAEGPVARLWNNQGDLVERELTFTAPDAPGARDAAREVFPGCPLTFQLAELLRPSPMPLERLVLRCTREAPADDVALKLWHQCFPHSHRARLTRPFARGWHFSLLLLFRCEIQAVDQHWSLHRLAVSLPEGEPDDNLAERLDFLEIDPAPEEPLSWPSVDLSASWLGLALKAELARELEQTQRRQQNYLQRELDRIETYFINYEHELKSRQMRSHSQPSIDKLEQRLTAARLEHERRRQDQIQRHEIQLIPHLDALLAVAEPVWVTAVSHVRERAEHEQTARFVPRTRRWYVDEPGDGQ